MFSVQTIGAFVSASHAFRECFYSQWKGIRIRLESRRPLISVNILIELQKNPRSGKDNFIQTEVKSPFMFVFQCRESGPAMLL